MAALPAIFVFIWAAGFIVAGIVAGRADPLTFLAVRHALTVVVFALLAIGARAAWPRAPRAWLEAMAVGVLLHGIYVAGVFWAVAHGLPAGLTGLVTGLQPLVTAAFAVPLLGERLSPRQWSAIGVGLAGIALVVAPKAAPVEGAPLAPLAVALAATLSLSMGTVAQKYAQPRSDLRVNAAMQFVGAFVATAPVAWLTESHYFDNSPELLGALGWAVLGPSVGGVAIMLTLLRRGTASAVAPLLYLAPPLAGLMAWVLFGEALTAWQVGGMALAAAGAFGARPGTLRPTRA